MAMAADLGTQLLLASFSLAGQGETEPVEDAQLRHGLEMVRGGRYLEALAAGLRGLWPPAGADAGGAAQPDCTPDWFEAFQAAIAARLGTAAAGDEQLPLLAAVAALYVFVQANLAGPSAPALPECPFDLLEDGVLADAVQAAAAADPTAQQQPAAGSGELGRDTISPGDRWAVSQLCEDGEEIIGRIRSPQYLLLACRILHSPAALTTPPSPEQPTPASEPAAAGVVARSVLLPAWAWWAQRAALLQQRTLAGRSATLRRLLEGLTAQVLAAYAPTEQEKQGNEGLAPVARLLRCAALLEAALMETAFGYVEAAGQYLQQSCEALEFSAELTGAMGVRTLHQQEAKAQLVVEVQRGEGCLAVAALEQGVDASLLERALAGGQQSEELKGFDAESDVLPQPQLVGSTGVQQPTELGSLEQALLLALCTHLRKGSSADALKPWEAAAYVDAVVRQQRSQFLLRWAAQLQTIRHEKERVRTRERALLALEQLAGATSTPVEGLPPQLRASHAFSAWFPLGVSLRKELGELLVAAGAVGAALPLFESLELWDSLAVCYQLLGKKVQAEELVRRRLEAQQDEPRLWCTLGDLSMDDKYYEEAWERSGHRSARAQRSLARNAIRRGDWAGAAAHWEAALALNPLNPEGWFSLGFAYIKEKEYEKAVKACSRCVQLDPTNGEAWNNLAAVHMHAQRWAEAFGALGEATKHKRESWQTWENYAEVAAKVHQWQVSVRALREVLGLSQGQRAHLGILGEIVGEIERARAAPSADAAGAAGAHPAAAAAAAAAATGSSAGTAAAAAEGATAAPRAAPLQPSGAEEAAADQEGADEAEPSTEGVEALAQALASVGSMGTGSSSSTGAPSNTQQQAPAAAAASWRNPEVLAAAEAHAKEALERAAGLLLKEVAGTAAGDSAFWELYARYYAAVGQAEAARECLLKRVRALAGRGWQQEEEGFKAFAHASLQLCRNYLQEGGARELSSARMHLRGVVRQAAERYGEHPLFADLQRLLADVEAAQERQQQERQQG